MPNANTVDRVVGAGSPAQGTKAAPAITLVGTTEKLVLDQTGATAIVSAQPVGQPTTLGPSDDLKFVVRATFKTTTGGSSTSVVNLYVGNAIVSGNKLASITSQSLATASASGFIEAHCIWDSTAKVISGYQLAAYGTASPIAAAALTSTAISVTATTGLTFCISATNGSSVTGTTFTLGELCLEVN
jgi:hypothetical protein